MAHVSLGTSCRARYAEHISKYGLLNTAAHTQHIQQSCAHVVVYNILYIIGGAATNAGDDCEHVTSGITDVVRQYAFFVRAVVFVSDVPANRQSESSINCSCKHCACACSVCTCFNCTAIHRERQGVCVHGRERLHCNDLMYRFPGYGWLSHPHTHMQG